MGLSWAEETVEIAGSAEDCFDAITDFETYPRWQPATEEAEVLERDGKKVGKRVRYRVDAGIRKIGYVLSYEYERPNRLAWDSTEGHGVKRITGEYLFEERDGRTMATIKLGADPGAGVPGVIARRLNNQKTRQSIEELKAEVERRAGVPAGVPATSPERRSLIRTGVELPVEVALRAGSIGIGVAESALGRISELLGRSEREKEDEEREELEVVEVDEGEEEEEEAEETTGDLKTVARPLIVGVLLVSAFVFFFVFPGHDPEPRGVQVVAAGPANATAIVAEKLGRQSAGFEVERLPDAGAARRAILDREAYGAVVLDEADGPRILVASAASFQVARILREALVPTAGGQAPVTDVVPLDEDDPVGTSVNLTSLPLAITSILGALVLLSLAPSLTVGRRLEVQAVLAVLAGLAAVLIVNVAIGAIPGTFIGLTAISALLVASIALPSAGIIALLGQPGVGASFMLFLMLGFPASGAASAPQLLPEPWQTGGQFLQAGAGATGIRNIAYFDGAALLKPVAVLTAWALIGMALVVLASRRAAQAPR